MSQKKKTGIIAFVIVVILAIVAAAAGIIRETQLFRAQPFAHSRNSSVKVTIRSKGPYIARLHIDGVINENTATYSHEWYHQAVKQLSQDPKNVGILLVINSPGGSAYYSDELYMDLQDYKKTGKPVYAYLKELSASGGYYLACAADFIASNRNTLSGSIGVLAGNSLDVTGLMEKVGVKVVTVHAGANKNMGSFNEPLTQEQHDIMQTLADESYQQFVEIVSKSRKMDIEKTRTLADGRIYSAKQALEHGLIDEISRQEDFEQKIIEQDFPDISAEYIDIKYQAPETLLSSLGIPFLKSNVSAQQEILKKAILPQMTYPAYYYTQGINY